MACRGVHFAIDKEQYEKLLSAKSDEEWLDETDKAWDAIHRCLTNGKLEWDSGEFPLNAVIIGGEQLHEGDSYIISAVSPEEIPMAATALNVIDESVFKCGYEKIYQSNYDGEIGA